MEITPIKKAPPDYRRMFERDMKRALQGFGVSSPKCDIPEGGILWTQLSHTYWLRLIRFPVTKISDNPVTEFSIYPPASDAVEIEGLTIVVYNRGNIEIMQAFEADLDEETRDLRRWAMDGRPVVLNTARNDLRMMHYVGGEKERESYALLAEARQKTLLGSLQPFNHEPYLFCRRRFLHTFEQYLVQHQKIHGLSRRQRKMSSILELELSVD